MLSRGDPNEMSGVFPKVYNKGCHSVLKSLFCGTQCLLMREKREMTPTLPNQREIGVASSRITSTCDSKMDITRIGDIQQTSKLHTAAIKSGISTRIEIGHKPCVELCYELLNKVHEIPCFILRPMQNRVSAYSSKKSIAPRRMSRSTM